MEETCSTLYQAGHARHSNICLPPCLHWIWAHQWASLSWLDGHISCEHRTKFLVAPQPASLDSALWANHQMSLQRARTCKRTWPMACRRSLRMIPNEFQHCLDMWVNSQSGSTQGQSIYLDVWVPFSCWFRETVSPLPSHTSQLIHWVQTH